MRHYETMIIVHPNIEETGVAKIVQDVKGMIDKRGGEVLYSEDLGKRKLAYPVEKQRFGTYLQFQFTGDGTGNSELLLELEHTDNILAQMIVKIREQDIREEREEEPEAKATEDATEYASSKAEYAESFVATETVAADMDEEPAGEVAEAVAEEVVEAAAEAAAEEPQVKVAAEVALEAAVADHVVAEAEPEPAAAEEN